MFQGRQGLVAIELASTLAGTSSVSMILLEPRDDQHVLLAPQDTALLAGYKLERRCRFSIVSVGANGAPGEVIAAEQASATTFQIQKPTLACSPEDADSYFSDIDYMCALWNTATRAWAADDCSTVNDMPGSGDRVSCHCTVLSQIRCLANMSQLEPTPFSTIIQPCTGRRILLTVILCAGQLERMSSYRFYRGISANGVEKFDSC